MPHPHRFERFGARLVRGLGVAGLLLTCGTAGSQSAFEVGTLRCGTAVAPDEALRRLNAVRLQGAVCHAAADRAVAAPLRWSERLAAVAATQSAEMAALSRMAHRDRFDRALDARLGAAGYRFSSAVENIAVGYPSLDEVVEAWLASDAHCDNLLIAAASEVGLACSDAEGLRGERYWTLVLGAPQRPR